jgi:adenylate cyclase
LCNVQHTPDADGVFRRIKLFNVFDQKIFPTLGIGNLSGAPSTGVITINADRLTVTIIRSLFDQHGMQFCSIAGQSEHIHLILLLKCCWQKAEYSQKSLRPRENGNLQRSQGKYVLFGFSAPGLKRFAPAPVGGIYSGVEIKRHSA